MVEDYSNQMIHNINENYYENERKYGIKESLINSAVIATTGVGLICLFGGNVGVGLGLITAGMGIAGYRVKIGLKYKNTETRLKQEKKHMRIEREKEVSDDKDQKRIDKIYTLSIKSLFANRSYEYANEVTMYTYALIGLGSIFTAINPTSVWVPVLGISVGVLATIDEIKKHKKKEVLENRINNLKRDLNVNCILVEQEKQKKIEEQKELEEEKVFGVTYEEFKKIYEDNKGFDVKYPNDKPKQFIKK